MKKPSETTMYMTGAIVAVIAAIVITTQFGTSEPATTEEDAARRTDAVQTSRIDREEPTRSDIGVVPGRVSTTEVSTRRGGADD